MKKYHLELFSGTHSFGKISKKYNYEVISLDRDLKGKCPFSDYDNSKNHIQEDIMTWDYKNYPIQNFELITASPVCLWWSSLRNSWIGRKCKSIHPTEIITKELIEKDIEKYGKPMVDKVIEIIEYFKPKYWIIENPQTGKMKNYISCQYPKYDIYNDFSYCKFSDWGYEKKTRFWNNIKGLENKLCKKDCENIISFNNQKIHKERMGNSHKTIIDNGKIIRVNTKELREKYKDYENIKIVESKQKKYNICKGTKKLERYRIPEKLITYFFNNMVQYIMSEKKNEIKLKNVKNVFNKSILEQKKLKITKQDLKDLKREKFKNILNIF